MPYRFELSQSLTPSIEAIPLLELQAKLAQEIALIREEMGYEAKEGLKNILKQLISRMTPPSSKNSQESLEKFEKIKQSLEKFTLDEDFQALLLEHCGDVFKKKSDAKKIAAEFIYQKEYVRSGNAFTVQQPSGFAQLIQMDKHFFMDAVLNPEKLKKEVESAECSIQEIERDRKEKPLTEANEKTLLGFHRTRSEHAEALKIAERYMPFINKISATVQSLLQLQQDGQRPLLNFLQDVYILNELEFLVSDRLASRFRARFGQIHSKSSLKDFETAAINCASEFVLVSLGIVDPNIFCINKKEITPEEAKAYQVFCKKINVDPIKLAEHYQLQTSGTIFWNRYFVKGQKPSRITDEKIQYFITNTVRKDKDEILKAMNFKEVFKSLKADIQDLKKQKDQEGLEATLNGALAVMLCESEFQRMIIKKIASDEWRRTLLFFYEKI